MNPLKTIGSGIVNGIGGTLNKVMSLGQRKATVAAKMVKPAIAQAAPKEYNKGFGAYKRNLDEALTY